VRCVCEGSAVGCILSCLVIVIVVHGMHVCVRDMCVRESVVSFLVIVVRGVCVCMREREREREREEGRGIERESARACVCLWCAL